ncbi:ROK family protein [Adlercreutzia aquisgranensis]|uniref:ROK family protein n=1 Tax=Adlercreutzia aquisgranensis TaxID=2941323 RepID=UPI00203F8100|nr:ROK family protein [Adlercreutzia aquisgranensis]
MEYLGIPYSVRNTPVLDPDFIPFGIWAKAYLVEADHPIAIAVEREDGLISVRESFIRGPEFAEANFRYVERLVKFTLWSKGGFRVYLKGADDIAEKLATAYSPDGERWFDYQFVGDVYEKPLEVIACTDETFPAANESAKAIGGHLKGCRIGFDAGGSDRKVSAVIDGEPVYSEEVVWFPKITEDPEYHFNEIVTAFKTAASKMPRVDAIGVSSAGTFVGNSPMVASLFIKVPRERRDEVKSIYDRAGAEIGDVPLVVANDGDVTALAGFMSTGEGDILGVAMGTSEAVGYVNDEGNVLGWINELAFAPVDLSPDAMQDEWSTDFGVGCKYFSQDAVIKLAPRANIELDPELSPAEKLKVVQALANDGNEDALNIYRSIGCYLAHTLVLYSMFYKIRTLLVLGRVASGDGGDLLISECNRVLREEHPELASQITVTLPDEKMRRVGQSVAAASLPAL